MKPALFFLILFALLSCKKEDDAQSVERLSAKFDIEGQFEGIERYERSDFPQNDEEWERKATVEITDDGHYRMVTIDGSVSFNTGLNSNGWDTEYKGDTLILFPYTKDRGICFFSYNSNSQKLAGYDISSDTYFSYEVTRSFIGYKSK